MSEKKRLKRMNGGQESKRQAIREGRIRVGKIERGEGEKERIERQRTEYSTSSILQRREK